MAVTASESLSNPGHIYEAAGTSTDAVLSGFQIINHAVAQDPLGFSGGYRYRDIVSRRYLRFTQSAIATTTATPSSFNSPGMGVLLAYAWHVHGANAEVVERWSRRCLSVGLGLDVVVIALRLLPTAFAVYPILYTTATAAVFGWVVHHAARGFSGLTGVVLGSRGLQRQIPFATLPTGSARAQARVVA